MRAAMDGGKRVEDDHWVRKLTVEVTLTLAKKSCIFFIISTSLDNPDADYIVEIQQSTLE